jgi:hypothetical protein
MIYLDHILTYGSLLAETVALVLTGLATWKLAKLLREKTFLWAAWGMASSLLMTGLLVLVNSAWSWLPVDFHARFGKGYVVLHQIQAALFLVFVAMFAIGAVRCGSRAKKAAP